MATTRTIRRWPPRDGAHFFSTVFVFSLAVVSLALSGQFLGDAGPPGEFLHTPPMMIFRWDLSCLMLCFVPRETFRRRKWST